ncbi:radical SAM protein [Desulfosporosinus shakirovi]|uniref:hypothetical protein n=1 Tax=Desulfosporosinus shakirovi TaxID=2885154 RepID=UPI001E644744|nr:hypothetical protein [Desulfosporosinus sp. SRJS8]MCB8818666.1 hypothetical protein [Desulfosporosinus sp. SRJS8]
MYIAVLNLEPQYINNAIEKIRRYHQGRGDIVEDYVPLFTAQYDKVYCSSIFSYTPKEHLFIDERWECGGTGFDVEKKLSPCIETIKLNMNLGWTQRGCNNNCKFCVVPKKEGKAHPVGDIYDIWDGKSKTITLYDNNILQLPEHFYKISEQIYKEDLEVDWNQGLDIRLVDDDIAKTLSKIPHAAYHFAFDHPNMAEIITEKVEILKKYGINRSMFYVLVGCKDSSDKTLEEDIEGALFRLNHLKKLKMNAYVMRYQKCYVDQPESFIGDKTRKIYIPLANWGSVPAALHSMEFYKDYLATHERGMPYWKNYKQLGLVS